MEWKSRHWNTEAKRCRMPRANTEIITTPLKLATRI
jgi:hypothetical protein